MIPAIIKMVLIIGIIGWIVYRESKRRARLATFYKFSAEAKELADKAVHVREHIDKQFEDLFYKIDAQMPKPRPRICKELFGDLLETETAKIPRPVIYTRKQPILSFYNQEKGIQETPYEPFESMFKSMKEESELEIQFTLKFKRLSAVEEDKYIFKSHERMWPFRSSTS